MKASANFKMSKPTKRTLMRFDNQNTRAMYKKLMIQAEMVAAIKPKTAREQDQ